MIIVSNTSPITNLAAIGQIELLQKIYKTIFIPQAVYDEMANLGYDVPGTKEVQTLDWIKIKTVIDSDLVAQLQTEIDKGESEAIALAIEINADQLIIDDYQGRQIANNLNLNVVGILGILLIAKERGFITMIQPMMDDLINIAGFRISSQLYKNILIMANEF